MAERHALLTGPVSGPVQLEDGTTVDVTPAVLYFDTPQEAAEVAHAIGKRHAKLGHPHDVDIDPKTGDPVQRKFAYDDSHYRKNKKGR